MELQNEKARGRARRPAVAHATLFKDLPVLPFADAAAWEQWLADNHTDAPGLWLKLAKRASGIASVTYGEAVEVALCFGWIDSQKAGWDELWFLQRFTPRRARSRWSRANRDKVQELESEERLRPAGAREVALAREDGRWEAAYAGQASAEVPEDLRRELEKDPKAWRFFESLESHNRYSIIYRIEEARRPQTRAQRVQRFMEMMRAGEKPHP